MKSESGISNMWRKFAPTHRSRDMAHAQWLQTPSACQCWDYAIEDTQPIFRGGPDPYTAYSIRAAPVVLASCLPPLSLMDDSFAWMNAQDNHGNTSCFLHPLRTTDGRNVTTFTSSAVSIFHVWFEEYCSHLGLPVWFIINLSAANCRV